MIIIFVSSPYLGTMPDVVVRILKTPISFLAVRLYCFQCHVIFLSSVVHLSPWSKKISKSQEPRVIFVMHIYTYKCILISQHTSKSMLGQNIQTKQSRGCTNDSTLWQYQHFFPFVTHPLLVSVDDVELRLLPTFAGILQEKIRTRTIFTKILANYTSEESLITAVYDENMI